MVWMVWDQRNRCTFDGISPRTSGTVASFWAYMREANYGNLGCMRNSAFDLRILSSFGVAGKSSKAPTVICLKWQLPPCWVVEVNIDGSAAGSTGQLTGGASSGIILVFFVAILQRVMELDLPSKLN
ncbi:hypothetical protein ACS0TY_033663 [Phlomoides rotata]